MKNVFSGFNTSLISIGSFSIIFLMVIYCQVYIQPWQPYFFNALQVISIITVLFSAQFNQSRFSLLIVLLMLFYCIDFFHLPELRLWQENDEWQLLTSLFCFTVLAFVKDRGLFSIHILYRLLAFISCLLLAYSWQQGVEGLIEAYQNNQLLLPYIAWLKLYIPIAVCFLIILFRSLSTKQLFLPALLVTSSIFILTYFQLLTVPWLTVLLLLIIYFLLNVITGSYLLAYRDELTGIPSRRALYQFSLSLGRKYSVAMMDIDHFKKFNDTYGHDIGDQVLKLVATKLANIKGGGRTYRYGGEEFTVIFPRKTAEQTLDELEKLRQSIADYEMVIRQPNRQGKDGRKNNKSSDEKTVSITVSIGVSSRMSKQSFDQVMKAADEKLYKAKKSGRNNVTH